MEFFAHDDVVAQLALRAQSDPHDLENLLALSWQLRQRDWQRALQLAQQITLQLASTADQTYTQTQHQQMQIRLQLIQGETLWLRGEFASCKQLADAALVQVIKLPQSSEALELHCDTLWLLGSLHNEGGQFSARDQSWQQMHQLLQQLGDRQRLGSAEAVIASSISFRSAREAEHLAKAYLDSDLSLWPLATRAAIYEFLGMQVRMGSELSHALVYWMQAFEAYRQTGQLRRTIHMASNIGNWFSKLNDANTALEWTDLALKLARPIGWPHTLGVCLLHSTNALRQIGKIDAAQAMLHEALAILVDWPISRAYAISLWTLGDMALVSGDADIAYSAFCRLQECADTLAHSDFQTNARRGQAQALTQLGRYDEALQQAQMGLQLASNQVDVKGQLAALQTIASIYDKHQLAAPPDMQAATPQLHYLLQALGIGKAIENFNMPGELLDAIGEAYANIDDFKLAYAFSRSANLAREKNHTIIAANRANALQAQHQAEQARTEREYLRQLAIAEAQRAQVLQNTSTTLAHLGAIGQEITAELDPQAVCHSILRHVHSLLDTNYFVIYLFDGDGQHLHSIFRRQEKQPLPTITLKVDDPRSLAARCAREQQQLVFNDSQDAAGLALELETLPTFSGMFGPLSTSKRNLGVMTIQSRRSAAYGEREELIFRTLCAYGAIALDNAFAYQKLQEAQQQLVEQEKLAALGSLVAGVAHELNTPLGNSLVTASGLQDYTDELERLVLGKRLKLSELTSFIAKQREGMGLVMRGLQSAANLVVSFKQVAADRTTAQRRCFDLRQTTHEVVATLMSQIRAGGHRIQLQIAPDILLDSYPGPYGQVISNFIDNAVTHGFAGRDNGVIQIQASMPKAGRVLLLFSDNGVGIAEADRKRIFEPFFTTSLGRGGNGLGLSICYNIVTSMLQGQISVESSASTGTAFSLDLPLVVSS